MIIKNNKLVHWVLLFAANILLFYLLALLLPIRFEENDDVVMSWIASGYYSGTPDPHLVFINYIYGVLVSSLYNITSKIEWYTLIFFLIHVVSVTIIAKVIIERKKPKFLTASFLIFLYILEVRNIVQFQFTTTAAIGAIAGLLLIISAVRNHRLFLGGVMFLIASLIRFDASMLVGLLFAVFFLCNNKISENFFSPIFLTLILIFFLSISFKFIDTKIYSSEHDWKYYTEYNKLRGQINDNPNAKFIEERELPFGVSMNDYTLLISFFPDARTITIDKMEQIKGKLSSVQLSSKIANIYPALRSYTTVLLLLFSFVLFYGLYELIKFRRINTFVIYFAFILIISIISLDATVKQRVMISLIMTFVAFFLFYYKSTHKWLGYIIALLVLANAGLWAKRTFKIREAKNIWYEERHKEQVALISQLDKKTIIVPFGADFNIEFIPAFSLSRSLENQFNFFGWLSANPLNLISNYQDLTMENCVIFCSKNNYPYVVKSLEKSLMENYFITPSINLIDDSDNYVIFNID